MISIVLKYIKANLLMSLIGFYFLVACTLYYLNIVNIGIPCLWTTLFDIECWGCGLTRAFIKLATFDFAGAYAMNPMIYIVAPLGSFIVISDFLKFYKRSRLKVNPDPSA